MSLQLDVTGLTDTQIESIQTIINAFKLTNNLNLQPVSNPANDQQKPLNSTDKGILQELMENPIEVDGFLSREEIYNRFP